MNKPCLIAIQMIVVALALAGCASAAPSPAKEDARKPSVVPGSFDITTDDLNDDNNNIMLYDPVEPKQVDYKTTDSQQAGGNKLKSSSFTVLERESSGAANRNSGSSRRPNLMVAESHGDDAERSGSPNVEKMKDIALNSREVRLVGPNQREVEMKDDLQTKVVVALENLQKEAKEVYGQVNEKLDKGWTELKNSEVWSQMNDKLDKGWTEVKKAEVWGQINDKLDKGWTDLKSMVESVVAPSSAAGKSG